MGVNKETIPTMIWYLLLVTATNAYYTKDECESLVKMKYEDKLIEGTVGGTTNLTSLIDVEEGCKWIFKSNTTTTECCYSDTIYNQCEEDSYINDKEKCRKNDTYKVHVDNNHIKCTLELFDLDYSDAGDYIQKTHFDNTLKLKINRNRDWEPPVLYSSVSLVSIVFVVAIWIWTI